MAQLCLDIYNIYIYFLIQLITSLLLNNIKYMKKLHTLLI